MAKILLLSIILFSCTSKISLPQQNNHQGNASTFFTVAKNLDAKQFDSLAAQYLQNGIIPAFLYRLVPVSLKMEHQGKTYKATIYVTPDYLSVGNDKDWARVPLTPMTAQEIADKLNCFLPTPKIVDEIYRQAKIKLPPHPLTEKRESPQTMYDHHVIIQQQYDGKPAFIAGIKKDVVISTQLENKAGKVAIYGWHKQDGTPIQPLYTGHTRNYVDYSHGTRLVYQHIKINGAWHNYKTVLQDSVLCKLITYEPANGFIKYAGK